MGFFENNRLVELITDYLKTQFEIIKLDIQEKLEEILVRIFKLILVAAGFAITLFFLLLGGSEWINQVLDSHFIGYFITAGIIGLASIVLFLSLKPRENESE
jgi:polyferredoxin